MDRTEIRKNIACVGEILEKGGYSEDTVKQFFRLTNRLVEFMDKHDIPAFTTEVGFRFLTEQYGYDINKLPDHNEQEIIRHLRKLSEYQLHGTVLLKRSSRPYAIPKAFSRATEAFVTYRRFEGIIDRNITTISLYLERFFGYLTTHSVTKIPQIKGMHIQGFLRFLTGFSNSTKDHTMRTVRQFMSFCFKNGYHKEDLSTFAPVVHYEKRARIPSSYTSEEVKKLLDSVDRGNPVGKRAYAVLMLITRLGLRSGDVAGLKFENINWEENRISLTQHKTGNPLTLPLLDDVGLAVIDYLKFGRPDCDLPNIFVTHRPPSPHSMERGIYGLVSEQLGRAGLLTVKRKRGPHALRHSLAGRLLEENVPLPVISEILGHADTNTTAAYLAIDISKLRLCSLEVSR
jgi:integrase